MSRCVQTFDWYCISISDRGDAVVFMYYTAMSHVLWQWDRNDWTVGFTWLPQLYPRWAGYSSTTLTGLGDGWSVGTRPASISSRSGPLLCSQNLRGEESTNRLSWKMSDGNFNKVNVQRQYCVCRSYLFYYENIMVPWEMAAVLRALNQLCVFFRIICNLFCT